MTAAGMILGIGGVLSLVAACRWAERCPRGSEKFAALWIGASVLAFAASFFIAADRPQKPARASEAWMVAPIAGAPLVRIDEAHSAFNGRRLPLSVADIEAVLP